MRNSAYLRVRIRGRIEYPQLLKQFAVFNFKEKTVTKIQTELVRALEAMGDRSRFTDGVLAKKLRETCRIEGRRKAVIALTDLLAALETLADQGRFYSVTVTNANDLLLERAESPKEILLEHRQRRQRHEKSCEIFTDSDMSVSGKVSGSARKKMRTERISLNVNKDWTE